MCDRSVSASRDAPRETANSIKARTAPAVTASPPVFAPATCGHDFDASRHSGLSGSDASVESPMWTPASSPRVLARWAGALNVLSALPDGFSVTVLRQVVVRNDAA